MSSEVEALVSNLLVVQRLHILKFCSDCDLFLLVINVTTLVAKYLGGTTQQELDLIIILKDLKQY